MIIKLGDGNKINVRIRSSEGQKQGDTKNENKDREKGNRISR